MGFLGRNVELGPLRHCLGPDRKLGVFVINLEFWRSHEISMGQWNVNVDKIDQKRDKIWTFPPLLGILCTLAGWEFRSIPRGSELGPLSRAALPLQSEIKCRQLWLCRWWQLCSLSRWYLCVGKIYQCLQSSEDGVTTRIWLKHARSENAHYLIITWGPLNW